MTKKGRRAAFFSVVIFAAVLVALCHGCAGRSSAAVGGGDTIPMRYARHITMVRHGMYTEVSLANPWKRGAELHRYILVDRKDSARVSGLPDGTVVYTPVDRCVVFTSPHCYLLGQIGAARAVVGVCDLAYINLPYVRDGVRSGRVADCGSSMAPSVERIVGVRPQAMFVSPFEGASYGQIDHLGIPLIECADYMETSALGRAEWMRFYGMLVGREREADSLFAVVERRYGALRAEARRSAIRPRVLTERVTGGVWYCPGGHSSMGRLIADAGGRYVFADDTHSGSLTLSPEKVVEKAQDADCWLFVYGEKAMPTSAQLADECQGYGLIRAFRDGNMYGCGSNTGVPYFEEISFRPDFLLADFVRIFHPEIRIGGKARYYGKIAR